MWLETVCALYAGFFLKMTINYFLGTKRKLQRGGIQPLKVKERE